MATEDESIGSFDYPLVNSVSDESLDMRSDVYDSDNETYCYDCEKCEHRAKQKHECIDGKLVYDFEHYSSIPETIYSFECVTQLIFDYNQLSRIPKEFCQKLSQLRVLSLLGNKLNELPPNIHLLEGLEELYVDENHLNYLPETLCQLSQLKKLHAQGNRLRLLPDSIDHLKQLECLKLNENRLKSLPTTFGFLAKLVELDLSYNSISSLPETFGSLSQLRILNLSYNKLSLLPSSFENLPNIEVFELSTNSIKLLPDSFASAKSLKKLYLDNNEICILPKWIGDMELVEEISLKINYLRGAQFPESFGIKSQKLIKFDISGNLIEELPQSLAQIKTLQLIDTGSHLFEPERRKHMRQGNNIQHLPKDFGLNFINMKELRLDENDIEELPQCFGDGMPNLEILDLYCNMIEYLPDSFCKLKSLRHFYIGMNCLKKLPHHFGSLTALEELRLELNQLKCLPPTFDQLMNLRVLDLYENKFDAFPAILKNLENIKSLQVGLEISEMVIKVTASQRTEIERLKRALSLGVISRTKLKSQLWDNSSSVPHDQQSQSIDISLRSSGYCSLQTSQDQVDKEVDHLEESWDTDDFDPQRPYLNEPLTYPNSHRIQTPLGQFKNFVPLELHPPRIRFKRQKLSTVEGQFDL